MKEDLSELRKIAESEETQKWGPWAFEEGDFDGYSIYINDGYNFGRSYIAQDISQGVSDGKSTAEFIATFDPKTVLDLLQEIEYQTNTRKALEKVLSKTTQRLEQAEQAEQAVARVRGFAESMGLNMSERYVSQSFLSDKILRLLDGDTCD